MTTRPLLDLIPAFYRLRDVDPDGSPGLLTALLTTIESSIEAVEADLRDRYDDLFVETCSPEELVHLQALLGIRELPGLRSPRALVAGVIGYRRRKGTLAALEDLARAAGGWTAKATEYFGLLATTQAVNHPRPGALAVAGIRDPVPLRWAATPFDPLLHTVDVRSVRSRRGRYNIPNVAVDLWRLDPVAEPRRPAVAVDATRYRFHPLGVDTALFSRGEPEGSVAHLAGPADATMPLRIVETAASWGGYYGPSESFVVRVGADPVAASDVVCTDLGDVGVGWGHTPPTHPVALDPSRGRIAFAQPPAAEVEVGYHRALPMPVGGGGYQREPAPAPSTDAVVVTVAAGADLAAAAQSVVDGGGVGVVEISDSGRYAVAGPLPVAPAGAFVLRAAEGQWPVLTDGLVLSAGPDAVMTLDGVLVSGGPVEVTGSPARVNLTHCTLVPGIGLDADGRPLQPLAASLVLRLDGDADTEVAIDHCILGPLLAPAELARVSLTSTIIASAATDGAAQLVAVRVGAVADPLPALGAGPLTLTLHVGVAADLPLQLSVPPGVAGVADLAPMLQAALDAAGAAATSGEPDGLAGLSVDTSAMTVTSEDGRLLVTGPGTDAIAFTDDGPDQGATVLGLAGGYAAYALVGGPLPDPWEAPTVPARLTVTLGAPGAAAAEETLTLDTAPASAADLASSLQALLRAGPDPGAVVIAQPGRLLVVPGSPGVAPRFVPDPVSRPLGLDAAGPAYAGSVDGLLSGPALAAEAVTVFGAVVAQEVQVGDSIVSGALVAQRRQTGCVRYSWLGPGSRTPRRFHCRGSDTGDAPPAFVATRYPAPAFGQLATWCPGTIGAGAADGAEMGVFHDVQSPQRLAAVQSLLEEYLRFNVEAGVFLVS